MPSKRARLSAAGEEGTGSAGNGRRPRAQQATGSAGSGGRQAAPACGAVLVSDSTSSAGGSHRDDETERISRSVASFGRYGSKRPKGLSVDGQGRFRLQDLVACWGRDVGLDEQAILRAVIVHMLREDGRIRFGIDQDEDGRVLIRVVPKRSGRGAGDPELKPGCRSTRHSDGVLSGRPRDGRGEVCGQAAELSPERTTKRLNVQHKLDMGLDDVIRSEAAGLQRPAGMLAARAPRVPERSPPRKRPVATFSSGSE